MNEWALWSIEKRMERAAKALEANGFTVTLLSGAEELRELAGKLASDAATVGFGGSVGIVEAGIPKMLSDAGKTCLIHLLPNLTLEERVEIMRRQLTCDLFLTGANAVTLDGKIVNIDATGNRIGAMTFGPKKVLIVAGANKLTENLEAAIARIKAQASPPNAKRLSLETPCATTGFCVDCKSPQRICRVVHIMEKKPRLTDVTVALLPVPLGL